VEEKFAKKIDGWKDNLLSTGDRVTLVNACLTSICLYMLSFLDAPKGFIHRADMLNDDTEEIGLGAHC
jgi:hypothetical protein